MRDESFYGQTQVLIPDVQARRRQTESVVGTAAAVESFVRSGRAAFGGSIEAHPDATFRPRTK